MKSEFAEYWSNFRLLDSRNYDQTFITDKLRPKFSFNRRNKDTIIETYLSCLAKKLLEDWDFFQKI